MRLPIHDAHVTSPGSWILADTSTSNETLGMEQTGRENLDHDRSLTQRQNAMAEGVLTEYSTQERPMSRAA